MNPEINLKLQYLSNYIDMKISINRTFFELKSKIVELIKEKLNILLNVDSLVIKYGYPPKPINKTDQTNLYSIQITNNELLRIEGEEKKQTIFREVVKADGSCLFNAINFCINGVKDEPETMREIVASAIEQNPNYYNSAILDRDPKEYCTWILMKDTWGGGIETSILSNFFQIRITVVDIVNVTFEDFGEVFYSFY